jgi:hypothetical protein
MKIQYLQITIQKVEEFPHMLKLRTKVSCLGKPDIFEEKILEEDEFTAIFDLIFDDARERIRKFALKEAKKSP